MDNWNWDELKPKKKKSALMQRIEEHDEKLSSGKTHVTHSLLYHRYFEGYSETKVLAPNGRSKIVREYVGEYYTRKGSDRMWILSKIAYIVIFLAAAFFYVYALTREAAVNHVWYAALPGLLSAIPAVLLFVTLISCTISSRKLTSYGFSLFGRLILLCLITGGLIFLYAVSCIIFMILNPSLASGTRLPLVMALIAAVIFASIAFIEYRTGYDKITNPRTPDPDSVIIS